MNVDIQQAMDRYMIPAANFSIIENFEIIATNAFSRHEAVSVNGESRFQACSLSKSLTAVAILLLLKQGRIDLDAPISNRFALNGSYVTARHCLSMTSGLSYGQPGTPIPTYKQEDPLPTVQQILDGAYPAKNPPIVCSSTPGILCKYSGAGFMVLQKLIEDVTQLPFATFMRENILIPLNMTHSTFECPLAEGRENAVPGFDKNVGRLNGDFDNNPYSASGGLWSTTSDIANFMIVISNAYLGKDNLFLSRALVQLMLTQQENSDFALGFVVDGKNATFNFRKNGHNNAYHCQLLMFPNTGQGIVIMTNSALGIHLIKDVIAQTAAQYQWPHYSPDFDELEITKNVVFKL